MQDPRVDPESLASAAITNAESNEQDAYRSLLLAQKALLGPVPEVSISFQDLTFHLHLPDNRKAVDESLPGGNQKDAARPHIPTVFGTIFSPVTALVKAVANGASGTKSSDEQTSSSNKKRAVKVLKVLDGASGTIRPGRMALIIAPSGASKSSLLKLLSGLSLSGTVKEVTGLPSAAEEIKPGVLYGDIRYNGLSKTETNALPVNLGSLISYVPQSDEHYAVLNVRETLEFAAHTKRCPFLSPEGTVGSVNTKAAELLASPSAAVTAMLSTMRLQEAEKTALGNEQIKGCSGGQRKRVTIAEALIGHHRVAALDEVSNGLDSSTTLDLMRAQKTWCEVTNGSVVAALLQPTPETVALFDDIILLKEGSIVYFGPKEEVAPYLTSFGFAVPSPAPAASSSDSIVHQQSSARGGPSGQHRSHHGHGQQHHQTDLADYLLELLSNPRAVWEKQKEKGLATTVVPPLTTQELTEAWKKRRGPDGLLAPPSSASALATPLPPSASSFDLRTPWAKQQYGSRYPVSTATQLKHLLTRQAKLTFRDWPFVFSKVGGAIFMALVLGSLFSGSEGNFTLLMGCTLFATVHLAFGGGIEIPTLIEQRFVVYKQLAAKMYGPALPVLTVAITLLPLTIMEVLVFSSITYFLSGFSNTAAQYFFFALILLLIALAEGAYFRLVAYLTATAQTANALTGPIVSLQVIFAGYLITYNSIPGYFVWIYWGLSPLSWALRAIANNELSSSQYNSMLPNGQTMRQFYLSTFEFQEGNQWMWAAVIFIIGFWFILLLVSILALTKVRFDRSIGSTRAESADQPENDDVAAATTTALAKPSAIAAAAVAPVSDEPTAVPAADVPVPMPAAPTATTTTGTATVALDMGVSMPSAEVSSVVLASASASAMAAAAVAASAAAAGVGNGNSSDDDIVSGASTPASLSVPSSPSNNNDSHADKSSRVAEEQVAPASDAAQVAIVIPTPSSASSSSYSSARHALPYTPLSLAFKDIVYDVPLPKKAGGGTRRLLRGVSGYVKPGQLLLLMGASGSGKSTLLDAIADRKTSGTLTGEVFLNGKKVDRRVFARQTSYVEQQDVHNSLTTVREALTFSAELRLPSSVTRHQREAFIDEILDILELTPIQHRMVGKPNSDGLSPSEFKRLSMGVELCSNAPILFVDEGTTGLASREAETVMRVLRRIADSGRAVVATIHAPSFQLYSLADSLILLQKGGYQVFSGPLGKPLGRNIITFIREAAALAAAPKSSNGGDDDNDEDGISLPYYLPYDGSQNPASYMLDALAEEADYLQQQQDGVNGNGGSSSGDSAEVTNKDGASKGTTTAAIATSSSSFKAPVGGWFAAYWPTSDWYKRAQQELEEVITTGAGNANSSAELSAAITSDYARSFPHQLWIMLKRCWLAHNRNLAFNLTRILVLTILGLLFGGIYYQLGPQAIPINSFAAITNTVSVIFLGLSFSGIITFSSALPLYESDRAVVFREKSSRMYSPYCYTLGMLMVEAPWLAITILVFCCCQYFLVGLVTSQGAGTFFHYFLILWQSGFLFTALSLFFASAFPSVAVAQATGGLIVSLYFLLAGLFAPKPQIPAGWAWFLEANPLYYGLEAIVTPQLQCYAANVTACPTMSVPLNGGIVTAPTYQYVFTYFGISYANRWSDVGYLFIFIAAFAIAGAICLRYINWIKR